MQQVPGRTQAVRLPANTRPTPARTATTPAAVGIQTVWSSWELTSSGPTFTTGLVSVQLTRLKNRPAMPSTISTMPKVAIGFMKPSRVEGITARGNKRFPAALAQRGSYFFIGVGVQKDAQFLSRAGDAVRRPIPYLGTDNDPGQENKHHELEHQRLKQPYE